MQFFESRHTHCCFILDCFALLSTALHCCISLHDDPPQFCTRLDCELHGLGGNSRDISLHPFSPPCSTSSLFPHHSIVAPFSALFWPFYSFFASVFSHRLCRFFGQKKSILPHSDGTCVSAFVEILTAYNVKSLSTLSSDNIQWNVKISFPWARFNNQLG